MERLLDYLNCTFWALSFTGSTNQAFFNFYWDRLFIFHLENLYRTSLYACAASSAFIIINYDLHHFSSLFNWNLMNFEQRNKNFWVCYWISSRSLIRISLIVVSALSFLPSQSARSLRYAPSESSPRR